MGYQEQKSEQEFRLDAEKFKAAQERYWQENPRRWDLLVKAGDLINDYNRYFKAGIEPTWDEEMLRRFVFVYSDNPNSQLLWHGASAERQEGGYATNNPEILNPLEIPFAIFINIDKKTEDNFFLQICMHELGHNLAFRGCVKNRFDPSDSTMYLEEGLVNYLADAGIHLVNYQEHGPIPYTSQISIRGIVFNQILDRTALLLNRKAKDNWARAYKRALQTIANGVLLGSYEKFDEILREIYPREEYQEFMDLLEQSYREYRSFKDEDVQIKLFNFVTGKSISKLEEVWNMPDKERRRSFVTPHIIFINQSPVKMKN